MLFGSDNQTGASDKVLAGIVEANDGHAHGYGDDQWTQQACSKINEVFECEARTFFLPTGTAANSLALSCLVNPWETILCHHQAHILIDESTAPEFFTGGARQIAITNTAGKINADHIHRFLSKNGTDAPHNPRPAALSLAQVSELGGVYSSEEITSLSEIAREHEMYMHIDGARFANAIAATGASPAALSWQAGVDVLTLGATKCGCLAAEAIIFFDQSLADSFEHRRKRSGHLLSKSRLLAAQFLAWLDDDHWLQLASHANQKAATLAAKLEKLENMRLAWPCEANEIFVIMNKTTEQQLKDAGAEFYQWYEQGLPAAEKLTENELLIRLVTSFKTMDTEIDAFFETASRDHAA